MNMVLIRLLCITVTVFLFACAQQGVKSGGGGVKEISDIERYLASGYRFLTGRSTQRAIDEFDRSIVLCHQQYALDSQQVFAARIQTEALYYLSSAKAISANGEGDKNILVIDTLCADAFYLRGYASLDLGQVAVAKVYVEKALALSPMNSIYLSELGHILQVERNYDAALQQFYVSEKAAKTFSPEDKRDKELARAKRGIGYSLIELGRLDEAERAFKACLALAPDDAKAKNELAYIKKLRMNMKK